MKVALITKAAVYGGLINHLQLLAIGLKMNNFDVTVITSPSANLSPLPELLKKEEIKHHSLLIKNKFDLAGFCKTVQYLKSGCFQIMHVHLTNIYSPTLIYLAGKVAGIKIIITTPHSLFPLKKSNPILEFIQMKYLSHFNSKIIGVCATNSELLKNKYISSSKVITIKNGIELNQNKLAARSSKYNIRKEFSLKDSNQIVGTVAALTPLKGINYFIKACKEVVKGLPNVVFFVVGDGRGMPALQKLTHDSGLENHIIFTGFRKDSDILLSQFDLFVLPSLTESLPTTILESLALKTPVIATDVGGVGEIIQHNETGLLVPAGDSSKLAEAIMILLHDRKKATQLAEASLELVQKEHNHIRMIQQTCELYSSLANQNN